MHSILRVTVRNPWTHLQQGCWKSIGAVINAHKLRYVIYTVPKGQSHLLVMHASVYNQVRILKGHAHFTTCRFAIS